MPLNTARRTAFSLASFAAGSCLTALLLVVPAMAAPTTIDFDGPAVGGSSSTFSPGGFKTTFSGVQSAISTGADYCSPQCAENGSRYLMVWAGSLTISSAGGTAFSLKSFDAAETFREKTSLWAPYIDAVGETSAGVQVTQRFALDFVQDGYGGAADFQTFSAGADFSDLVSVSLTGHGSRFSPFGMFALDNIRLGDAVATPDELPEPTTLALLFAALVAAGVATRRTHQTGKEAQAAA